MSDIAIRVESLSKAYRIGLSEQRHETMLAAMAALVKSPLSNLASLRRLSHFAANDDEDMIWALKDVTCEVKHGEVLGIIGRNGAGKSTLLKILSRITEPTHGLAKVYGRVGSLLEVGTGFHPDLTGRENIYLNGTILGMKRREIETLFDDIVEFAGIRKFIDTQVKRYSTGMRVRLGFAVAAHLNCEILIIDEVLAVGDAGFQAKCLGKMREVSRCGRCVLLVSHNMAAIRSLCTRAILIDRGSLALEGDPGQCIEAYHALSNQSELSPGPRSPKGDGLSIDEVLVNGVRLASLSQDEPIALSVRLGNLRNLEGFELIWRCEDQLGNLLFSLTRNSRELDIVLGKQTSLEIVTSFPPVHLNAGSYSLTLKARPWTGDKPSKTLVERRTFDVTGRHGEQGAILSPSETWRHYWAG